MKNLSFPLLLIAVLFFFPAKAHGGIDIDLNLPVGFKSVSPAQFSVVRDDRFVLKGKLKDDFKISSVSIKGTEARIDDENGFEFSRLQLREGLNTFLISLTDANGRRRLISYSVYSEPRGPAVGGGSIVNRPVITTDMVAEGYTTPPRKKLSTRIERRTEKPKPPASNKNLDVVFSSPYSGQIITEKELKTGGKFNTEAGITSITINGQLCILHRDSGTFEGPTLICPGKARELNVNADSPKYILMRVDPKTHSGENILKVKVTPSEGKPYEDRLVYHYYQLFVSAYSDNTFVMTFENNGLVNTEKYKTPNIEIFNKLLFYESPFAGWLSNKCNSRIFMPSHPRYDRGVTGYIYGECSPFITKSRIDWLSPSICQDWGIFSNYDTAVMEEHTFVTLHSPPKSVKQFMVVFRNCAFMDYAYGADIEVNPVEYSANGHALIPLSGSFKDYYKENIAYIVLDNDNPDRDFYLSVAIPEYIPALPTSVGYVSSYFSSRVEDGIRGDILVDSNNDGFLGGEDNAVEQTEPGCVFWVNNDDDYDELTKVHPNDGKAVNSNGNDSADDNINGIRDLEDFMPINITIPNIQEWAKQDLNIRFYFKTEGSGRIKIYERERDIRDYGSLSYLRDLNSSIAQYNHKIIPVDKDNNNQITLTPELFDEKGQFHGIFEGVNEGQLKLTLTVAIIDDKTKIIRDEILLDEAYITLKGVRKMYRLLNVRKGPTYSSEDKLTRYRDIDSSGEILSINNDKVFIWAHGYNTSIRKEGEKIDSRTDSLMVIDTVYKRMYRAGFRGPFIGLTWHGDEGTVADFNDNWINSFQTGHVVAKIFTDIRNEYRQSEINVSAHSLGNNVFCYALRLLAVQPQTHTQIDNLILAEAAIPGEVFSGDERNLRHNIWNNRYYGFFGNMYGIDTSVVKNIVYNTYSTTDEVLSKAFETNEIMKSLPTPLDLDYELVENEWNYKSCMMEYRSKALGLAYAGSKYNKIVNYTFNYSSDNSTKKGADPRPYGIRKHGSMMDEYYSDVAEYYRFLINPSAYQSDKTGGNL